MTIEQQADGSPFQAPRPFLLAYRQADGDASHVSDLEIEQHKIRIAGLDDGKDVGARANPEDRTVLGGKRGVDFSRYVVGVSGKQHGRHSANATKLGGEK